MTVLINIGFKNNISAMQKVVHICKTTFVFAHLILLMPIYHINISKD